MKRFFITVALSALLLASCGSQNTPPPQDLTETNLPNETLQEETQAYTELSTETDSLETEPEPEKNEFVSPLAEEDFMLPFEQYSWEREFDIEYIVLHFTSNVVNSKNDPHNMDSIKKLFEETSVSIHYIIDRDGSIKCFIPENYAAWHAGAGTFGDDEKYTNKMNKYSIGIEMLAIGSQNDMSQYMSADEYNCLNKEYIGFTDEQYEALKLLLQDVCQRNGIAYDREHIIGHDEYNPKKSDPGELFDWSKLFN